MSCSTRSTEPVARARGGFTLIEVIIAVAIFSIVIAIGLQQVSESTDATRTVTAQADLRRVGEGVMNEVVRDLRSTLAPFAGVATTNDAIEFWRVTELDFDSSGNGIGRPPLNGPVNFRWTLAPNSDDDDDDDGISGMPAPYPRIETKPANETKPTFGQTLIHRYKQSGTDLLHQYGKRSELTGASPTTIVMTKELAPVNDNQPGVGTVSGFTVTADQPSPGLMTIDGNNRFRDKPTIVTLKLVLKRLIGVHPKTFDKQYAWVTITNKVELRPTRKY